MQELQNFGRNEWFRNDGKILPVYDIFLQIVVLTICKVPIQLTGQFCHMARCKIDFRLKYETWNKDGRNTIPFPLALNVKSIAISIWMTAHLVSMGIINVDTVFSLNIWPSIYRVSRVDDKAIRKEHIPWHANTRFTLSVKSLHIGMSYYVLWSFGGLVFNEQFLTSMIRI